MRSLFAFWGVAGVLFLLSFLGRSATLGSEAIHATLDALVVTMTWRASRLLERRDNNYTYGMHRLEVMYSLLNVMTVILGVVVGVVVSLFFLAFRIVDDPVILIIASGVALVLSLISSTDKGDELHRGISLHAILDSVSYAIG
ncbi:cation transporter [Metallosphaera hakonensis]|nr:cation transporter [Metallosphaera hakonensis]